MESSVNPVETSAKEAELIESILSGQPAKFEVLVGNYQHRIYATLVGMLGNPHDAEDIAQETFLTAFKKLSSFERRSSFYTWLHRIAFNLAIDLQRRKKRSKTHAASETLDTTQPIDVPMNGSPVEAMMNHETAGQVRHALSKLDEERRHIIVLRDLQGLDYAEIASVLDIPIGTVRSRLHRARLELREIMCSIGLGAEPSVDSTTTQTTSPLASLGRPSL